MNCKPGDLAVFVRCSFPENVGKLVRIVDKLRCDPEEWRVVALGRLMTNAGFLTTPGQVVWADDPDLRPIRPGEGEDEMLLIAGKPEEVAA